VTTIFVTGTGTAVGKTWVLARLVSELRAANLSTTGRIVHARKPAQSFTVDERGQTDAEILGAASGEPATTVCPPHRWYELPMAPPMAAAALGLPPFTIADLARETVTTDITFVEGAGGPRSPLAFDGDNIDYARVLGVSLVVLVADAGLGTVNAVSLATMALAGFETLVMLNRFVAADDLHQRNRAWLAKAGHRISVTIPELLGHLETRLS